MPYPLLANPSDFTFNGYPVPDDGVLLSVSEDVRGDAGWHIAPVITETLTLASYGGYLLPLPTRRIVSLTAVRDVTTGSTVLTDWKRVGLALFRSSGWPVGTVEVDLTHGYASTPADLMPVIAARAARAVDLADPNVSQRTQSTGPFSETLSYRSTSPAGVALDPTLQRYALLPGVA